MGTPRFTFTDRAAPFCEVGFEDIRVGHTAAKWDVHQWDDPTSTWSGVEPTWRDIACEVWDASCEYGRAALPDRFVPGQANVIARNLDGWADPWTLGMRPGRPIRFGIDHATLGRRVLFRGFIDAVIPTYNPATAPQVELQCIDALGEVNRAALLPYPEPFPGDGQTADERISEILDRAAWPPTQRDLGASSWELIEHAQGGQVANLIGQAADSAGGSVWGDREGRIAFRNRDWQFYDPSTPVDAVIGNGPTGGADYLVDAAGDPILDSAGDFIDGTGTVSQGDVCPGQWVRPFDRASFSTRVIMGRDPETAVQVDDEVGQILYGIESFERTDLLTKDDLNIVDLAERTLETRSHTTAPRVRSVNFDARMGPAQLDLMYAADPYTPTHYRCRLIENDGRLVFDARYICTGVGHTISATAWTLNLNLDVAAPYAYGGDRWDTGTWDTAKWADITRAARSLRSDLERILT